MPTGRILAEGEAAEPALLFRRAVVVKLDGVGAAGAQHRREVHVDRVVVAFVLQRGGAEQDLVDGKIRVQLQLDAVVVLEHLEADGVLATDCLLVGVDPNVELVVEQVVVGTVAAVLTPQNIDSRRRSQRRGWLSPGRLRGRCLGECLATEHGDATAADYKDDFDQGPKAQAHGLPS